MREPQWEVKTCSLSSLHFGAEGRDENSRRSYYQAFLLFLFMSMNTFE